MYSTWSFKHKISQSQNLHKYRFTFIESCCSTAPVQLSFLLMSINFLLWSVLWMAQVVIICWNGKRDFQQDQRSPDSRISYLISQAHIYYERSFLFFTLVFCTIKLKKTNKCGRRQRSQNWYERSFCLQNYVLRFYFEFWNCRMPFLTQPYHFIRAWDRPWELPLQWLG